MQRQYAYPAHAICTAAGILGVVLLGNSMALAAPPTEARIAEIAKMLSPQPSRLAPRIADRGVWDEIARRDEGQRAIRDAEKLLDGPLPAQSDELFLDYSKTGNRDRWQRVAFSRRRRVGTLVIAECLENKGRFIPPLQKLVAEICSERTWVYPAHDGNLRNFEGKQVDIDLGSSRLGCELAFAAFLLDGKLPDEAHELIVRNVRERIFEPFEAMVRGKRKPNWWLSTTNNWNAVCLAGVTGAALSLLDDPQARAFYIASAESYSESFLSGFTPDGYCSEGLGYWNYGFGNYAMLTEYVLRATGGQLNLLGRDGAKLPAQFGRRVEIIDGVYPTFSDCTVGTKPDATLTDYLALSPGELDGAGWRFQGKPGQGGLMGAIAYGFAPSAEGERSAESAQEYSALRTWFEDAGVLISRPTPAAKPQFAVALKGGHNNEHHNHNDIGSFMVVVDGTTVLVDPGAEVYTKRTFSGQRYESDLLNSFGHSVPVLAGKLQRTGSQARGKVVEQRFSDEVDSITFDMTSAYDVEELERLQRTFDYKRGDSPELVVTDTVAFDTPQTFATALITFGEWKQVRPDTLRFEADGKALDVRVDTKGAAVKFTGSTIDEDVRAPKKPTRVAIELAEPVKNAVLTLHISPLNPAS